MSRLSFNSYLRIKTRDPRFLWKMVLGILGSGVVGALVAAQLPLKKPHALRLSLEAEEIMQGRARAAVGALEDLIDDPQAEYSELLELLPPVRRSLASGDHAVLDQVRTLLLAPRFSRPEQQISVGLWESLFAGGLRPSLLELTAAEPAPRYAFYAVGVFERSQRDFTAAAVAFEREGRFANAARARRHTVQLYMLIEDVGALARLSESPAYADAIDTRARLYLAALDGDWARVWWTIPATMTQSESWGASILAGLSGVYWLGFLLQAGGQASLRRAGCWLALAALALGVLSLWPTRMAVYWQDLGQGMDPGETLGEGLRYFILGVGLREEAAKLLLFAPLAPILVRRRNELEMLIVAGCVGLGFAVEENVGYFERTFSASSVARFLTANFLHIALTAIAGLALCRAIRWPRDFLVPFLGVFGIVVFAHGLYDAFLVVGPLAEYSFFNFIIFVLIAYQFFRELRELRGTRRETISLTANFLVGLSLLAAVTFVYISALLGIWLATMTFVLPALNLAIVVYVFLREMPESLVGV